MRFVSTNNDLELYVITGTNTVILSMDFKNKPINFLGFAFERKDIKSGAIKLLEGLKCFKSIVPTPIVGQKYPTLLHPIQSFMWKDFTVEENHRYEYTVTPLYGQADNLIQGTPASIAVKTEKHNFKNHRIYFNGGVAGSQAYSRIFNNKRLKDMDKDERENALEWLSRGLYEAFIKFIDNARPGQKLRGAFYEFKHEESLLALKRAKNRGVDVEIIYSGESYKDVNEEMIEKIGIKSICKYRRDNEVSIPHNKFLLHCGINNNPLNVWTGSTNLSEKAFFGHCNTGHVIKNRKIARKYYNYWKLLAQNPDRKELRILNHDLQEDIDPDNIPEGTSVLFCPRKNTALLDVFAKIIEKSEEMVCCIYPFNIDDRFEDVFKIDKPFIRYILRDKATTNNTFETNDKDVELVTGSYIKTPIDQWLNETSAGSIIHGGVNFLHNKIILVDSLSKNPIVISGSANYSETSMRYNDENILVIKDNLTVADIYLTEFVRLFDHFSFREWVNKNQDDFKPFLKESYWWVNKYFDNPEYRSVKRKLSFKNMYVPNLV